MKVWSKGIIVAGAVACLGALVPYAKLALAQSVGTPQAPQMSEKYFKHVTALTGIPVDEFMGTMGLFSAALSYCCGDCHVGAGTDNPKWEAETPRKIRARQMTLMVQAINKQNFGGQKAVTCWTCHRGSPAPSVTASIDQTYGEPLSFPQDIVRQAPNGVPTADQIFDKYVQALGGADAANRITSYTAKGTSHLFGETRDDAMEIWAKSPGLLATYVHQRGGDLARTWNGTDAWVMLPLTTVSEYFLTGTAKDGGKLDAEMAFPWKIKSFFPTWRVGAPITLDDRTVYVVQGAAAGANGFLATFYFDKETGLLTRMVRYANSSMGRVPTQIDYSDYRPVNGVKMPFKWTYGWVSGREEYALTDVQVNAAVDDAKFNKPVQVAAKK